MAYDSLVVLWTSGDKEVATKMVFMYTIKCQKEKLVECCHLDRLGAIWEVTE